MRLCNSYENNYTWFRQSMTSASELSPLLMDNHDQAIYTCYVSVDLEQYAIFRDKDGKGGTIHENSLEKIPLS